MKINVLWLVGIAALLFVLFAAGVLSYQTPAGNTAGNNGGNTGGDDNPLNNNDLISATKPLKITFNDAFSGTVGADATCTIYKAGQDVSSEPAITLSSGVATTTVPYKSGQVLNLYYVHDNSKFWQTVTVPQMTTGDSFQDYNYITAKCFAIGTYTDAMNFGATAVSDADTYNATASGTQPIFQYKLTNSVASTGLLESNDPLIPMAYDMYVVVSFSGTGAETVNIVNSGFDQIFMVGTTQYGLIQLNSAALTIWKDSTGAYKSIGNTKCTGTETLQFSVDMTGFASGSVTMQTTAYAYVDPAYGQDHNGSFGSQKVQLAEQTVTLVPI